MPDQMTRAAELKSQMRIAIKNVEADSRLTHDAKRARVRELREQTQMEVRRLHREWEQERAAKRVELRKVLFDPGYPGDSTGTDRVRIKSDYSRALDRAEAVKNAKEAQRLMARSLEVGDDLTVKALARVAYDRSFREPLDLFVADLPDREQQLRDLDEVTVVPRAPGALIGRSAAFGEVVAS